MNIKTYIVGMLQTNCYIVTDIDTRDCAVIDPGAESGGILNYIDDNKLNLCAVFVTHGHNDHTAALEGVASGGVRDDIPIYVHERDADKLPYTQNVRYYKEGDIVDIGAVTFKVLSTPGHTPGSVCLLAQHKNEDAAALFTGDTLFKDSCGRTDFNGGSMEQMMQSLLRLHNLSGDYEVYPGHGDTSTLERERRVNYYMRAAVENN